MVFLISSRANDSLSALKMKAGFECKRMKVPNLFCEIGCFDGSFPVEWMFLTLFVIFLLQIDVG